MVSPSDVESGLACGCICPECRAPLIAKKGVKVVWHFAHEGEACDNGLETAIHLMAKQILADERRVSLPAVEVVVSAFDAYRQEKKLSRRIAPPTIVEYRDVRLEVSRDNRRPDAVGVGGSATQEHFIEVFVRHAVDDVKAAEFKSRDVVCFEICLKDIQGTLSVDELRRAVTESPDRIRWISYPGMAAVKRELMLSLAESLEAVQQLKQLDNMEVKRHIPILEEEREEKAAWQRLEREEKLLLQRKKQRATKQMAANKTFKAASERDKRIFLRSKLKLADATIPPVINAHVTGEGSFGVARDIWQADVFRALVFSGFEAPECEFLTAHVFDWLLQRYDYTPQFQNSGKVALWQYCSFLETSGYLRHVGRQRFKVLKDTAPWGGREVGTELRGWFWTPEAYSFSFDDLCAACEELQLQLSKADLTILFRKVQAQHDKAQPEAIARTVARMTGRRAHDLLSALRHAGAVTNAFQ